MANRLEKSTEAKLHFASTSKKTSHYKKEILIPISCQLFVAKIPTKMNHSKQTAGKESMNESKKPDLFLDIISTFEFQRKKAAHNAF